MSNSRSVMIVSTFTTLLSSIFCAATIHRIRFIPSEAVRIVEKRLILITTIMTISLLGQFMVAVNQFCITFKISTYFGQFVNYQKDFETYYKAECIVKITKNIELFKFQTCFQFEHILWEFRKEVYNWLFVIQPFAADISNLAPAWIIHFLDKSIAYNKEGSSQNSSNMFVRHVNVR